MSKHRRSAAIGTGWFIGFGFLVAIPVAFLGFSSTEKSIKATSEKAFPLDIEFDKFRQILVRTNATAAIVEHGGMKLIEEKVEALKIDLSKDARPLRNAIAGKSKAEVSAVKRLTVELDDPQLNAKELTLDQNSQIHPDSIHVCTKSTVPAGELLSYEITLDAKQAEHQTEVTLSVDMTVGVRVSSLFSSQAESRVQKGADQAIHDQEMAIRALVLKFDDKSLILTWPLAKSGQIMLAIPSGDDLRELIQLYEFRPLFYGRCFPGALAAAHASFAERRVTGLTETI